MVRMGAREFVYPNFGYRQSRWLRNRDPVYGQCSSLLPSKFRLLGGFIPERNTGTLAGSLPLAGAFSGLSFDIALLSLTKLIFLS